MWLNCFQQLLPQLNANSCGLKLLGWLFYFVIFWLVQREEKLCMLQIKWVRYKGKAAGLDRCILNIFLGEGKWNYLSWHWWEEKERFVFGVDIVHPYCSISCLLLISSSRSVFPSQFHDFSNTIQLVSVCFLSVQCGLCENGSNKQYPVLLSCSIQPLCVSEDGFRSTFLLPADFLGSLFATSFFPSHSSCSLLDGTTLLSANDIRSLMRYCCFPLWKNYFRHIALYVNHLLPDKWSKRFEQ